MSTYNPDQWNETMWRALKSYIDSIVDSDIYEIIFGYPHIDVLTRLVPLEKTLIHFDIEDIREPPLGLGDNYLDYLRDETPPPTGQTISYWEARQHEVDFTIGVWASAQSGGVTSRLKARTLLSNLFSGSTAYRNCLSATDGIHIKRFGGGRNLIDSIGDVTVWRMVDVTLTVQVFSRVKLMPPVPYIGDIDDVIQQPQVEIGGVVLN